jgi:pilus assembly protein Flp/PilA
MKKGYSVFRTLMQDESGQDLIEYAIVAGLIGVGAVISMTSLTTKIKNTFNSVGNQLTNAV